MQYPFSLLCFCRLKPRIIFRIWIPCTLLAYSPVANFRAEIGFNINCAATEIPMKRSSFVQESHSNSNVPRQGKFHVQRKCVLFGDDYGPKVTVWTCNRNQGYCSRHNLYRASAPYKSWRQSTVRSWLQSIHKMLPLARVWTSRSYRRAPKNSKLGHQRVTRNLKRPHKQKFDDRF